MKIEVGKKYELNNGDIVECTGTSEYGAKYGYGSFILGGMYYHEDGRFGCAGLYHSFSVKREHISRAAQTPTLWRDMTDAEKGALLLAKFEGKDIEQFQYIRWVMVTPPVWSDNWAYRIKPTPNVEQCAVRLVGNDTGDVYYGTINLVDGTPDPTSIKMAAV
jgi:hypothetical protein